jgi:histidyl-tRNA synthetase
MRVERPRGTRDFLPEEMRKRRLMEERIRTITERWGYEEIRTPTFERAELFTLKSGQEILKELYEFEDKSGRHLALRPELTAPVIRLYLSELKMSPKPTKVYYFGNCFRYEEPQKARYREFWQFGTEIIGTDTAEAQAELIALAFTILTALGIEAELHVGHVGLIREVLREKPLTEEQINTVMHLIDKDQRDAVIELLTERNVTKPEIDKVLHLIDLTGRDTLREAVDRELITTESAAVRELEQLLEILAYYRIPYTLNLGIARGLDYYTGMVFEIYEAGGKLGAQNQLCGGGSYRLTALFGGDDVPSTGFAFGFDRLAEIYTVPAADLTRQSVVVVPVRSDPADRDVVREAVRIASLLRAFVPTHIDLMTRSISAQLKYANALSSSFAVMVGKDELHEGVVTLRNLSSGEQERLSVEVCMARIKSYFNLFELAEKPAYKPEVREEA